MEIVIPESMHTTIMDVNNAGPAAYSMFVAPFVIISTNSFAEGVISSIVTNAEKLLAKMKIKNIKNEIRIDSITYRVFVNTF